jgi:hypothetical protein
MKPEGILRSYFAGYSCQLIGKSGQPLQVCGIAKIIRALFFCGTFVFVMPAVGISVINSYICIRSAAAKMGQWMAGGF